MQSRSEICKEIRRVTVGLVEAREEGKGDDVVLRRDEARNHTNTHTHAREGKGRGDKRSSRRQVREDLGENRENLEGSKQREGHGMGTWAQPIIRGAVEGRYLPKSSHASFPQVDPGPGPGWWTMDQALNGDGTRREGATKRFGGVDFLLW